VSRGPFARYVDFSCFGFGFGFALTRMALPKRAGSCLRQHFALRAKTRHACWTLFRSAILVNAKPKPNPKQEKSTYLANGSHLARD
jgi:hypothetical protein